MKVRLEPFIINDKSFRVTLTGEYSVLNIYEQEAIKKRLESFYRKFYDFIGNTKMLLDIRKTNKRYKRREGYKFEASLRSEKGLFSAKAEGYGLIQPLKEVLERLEEQFYTEKVFEKPWVQYNHLEKRLEAQPI